MKKVTILLLAGMLLIISCTTKNTASKFEIQKGNFKATIIETGELQAVNAVSINMPPIGFKYGWQFKIIDLVENGAIVKIGEKIAKIDQSSVRKKIIELETQLNLEQANLNKQIIEQDNQINSLKTALQEEEANYELKKLEVETFKFESSQKRNIKKLEFEQVQINREKAIKNIQRQKIITENQIKIQKLKVNQIKLDIEDAYTAINKLDITSPINGIVQIKENRRSKQNFKIGDEIFLGQPFALVPEINFMKVKTSINELDYKKVHIGQKVKVRLDALPEVAFDGKICSLGKLSKPKEKDSRIKVFDAEVTIINHDERLKPGMTVSCEILYADLQNVLYVHNDCLLHENGKYYIYPEKDLKQEVKIDFSNNKYTVIRCKLKEGQTLFHIDKKNRSVNTKEA